MGKFKSWKHSGLFTSIATSTCLIGASAGLIFGVSAGTFKIEYQKLDNSQARVAAAKSAYSYYSQDIKSEWNMEKNQPTSQKIDKAWWNKMHNNAPMLINDELAKSLEAKAKYGSGVSENAQKARYEYASMIIDGSTHSTMDRSFNQGLYNGIVNFIQNKNVSSLDLSPETENDPTKNCAKSFKPGADNNTEFISIYNTVANKYKVVGLAGFNHVTPLNKLGEYDKANGKVNFTNNDINSTGFLLIDGDVSNNQNVSSVVFRTDQPGFLAGISTCMYFFNNLQTYHNKFQPLSVGAYGGAAIPTVTVYMGGIQRGLEFFNNFILMDNMLLKELRDLVINKKENEGIDYNDIKKLIEHSKYKDEINKLISKTNVAENEFSEIVNKLYDEYSIKMIRLGDSSTHFSGTFSAGDAIGITKQFLNRGASAIIAVAGPQSLDSAQEIQNQKSNCIVIGVDSAMEEGDYQRKFSKDYTDKSVAPDKSIPAQADNIIKFSAVKDMTSVTAKFAQLCVEGKNFDVADEKDENKPDAERAICGIGYKTCGNITNGLISISWDGWYPFVQAMSHIQNFKLYDPDKKEDVTTNFTNAWNKSVAYLIEHETDLELPEDFEKIVTDISKLKTYDKTAQGGCIYRNYSSLMAILGEFLNYVRVEIPKEMTVKVRTEQVEGKTVVHYEPETENKDMTILQWLKNNMYFTN